MSNEVFQELEKRSLGVVTSCRLYELPMTQERVLAALRAGGKGRRGKGKAA